MLNADEEDDDECEGGEGGEGRGFLPPWRDIVHGGGWVGGGGIRKAARGWESVENAIMKRKSGSQEGLERFQALLRQ